MLSRKCPELEIRRLTPCATDCPPTSLGLGFLLAKEGRCEGTMRVLRSLSVPSFHDSVHLECLASQVAVLERGGAGRGGGALGSGSVGPRL